MAGSSDIPNVSIDLSCDFGKDLITLCFEDQCHAKAYQAKIKEANIANENPNQAWLPRPSGMTSLRADAEGFIVAFESLHDSREWQKQTILGEQVLSNGEAIPELWFKRNWSRMDLEERIEGGGIYWGPQIDGATYQLRSSRFDANIEIAYASNRDDVPSVVDVIRHGLYTVVADMFSTIWNSIGYERR
ncbi:hypothetical protein F5Y04DRAFT_252899 [Hypomontagnella monticulosa]|nr:hypothetical protein F5Y04DRAFT_252899 [Hypomontagnella monticulosa]